MQVQIGEKEQNNINAESSCVTPNVYACRTMGCRQLAVMGGTKCYTSCTYDLSISKKLTYYEALSATTSSDPQVNGTQTGPFLNL